jgi:4'-phosphopantetheinyl transferase
MTGFVEPMPTGLPLSAGYVDLWLVPTVAPDSTLQSLFALLSPAERDRVDRLRIPAKRTEAIVSRGVLRKILGTLLQQDPSTLMFNTGPQGKPHLSDPSSPLCFNLSHTAGWVLLGVTLDRELGVDIENIRARSSLEELAVRFFTESEAASILALPATERPRAFFTAWCRKESVLKAAGQGISAGLNSFDVPIHSVVPPFKVFFAGQSWWLHDVALGESLVASVATAGVPAVVRSWSRKNAEA